jgi:hypothetical protein
LDEIFFASLKMENGKAFMCMENYVHKGFFIAIVIFDMG